MCSIALWTTHLQSKALFSKLIWAFIIQKRPIKHSCGAANHDRNINFQLVSSSIMTTFYSLILSHSPIRGDPGQQGWLLGSRRLVLERRILQSAPAHVASMRGRKWQHKAGSWCQEPVCQCNVCPVNKSFTWMPVQTGHEEGKELPGHLLEPPSVYHTWLVKDRTFLTFQNTIIIF